MKLLVACEESQEVTKAFRKKGVEAYSCDIQICSGEHPEWHINDDVLKIINGNIEFKTQNGEKHQITGEWDMIIAHPPCTRLCNSGQRWLYTGTETYTHNKKMEQEKGIKFFLDIANAKCKRIVIENPIGIMSTIYRKPDQIYHPYYFEGETEAKATCLWLKNVPPLFYTQILDKNLITHNIYKAKFNGKQYKWNDKEVAKLRSKTPKGVAKAMAEQWSKL